MEENTLPPVWVHDARGADDALRVILEQPVAGYDTEFYGCDITEESPVGKAVVDVFSIAVSTKQRHPLGYLIPRSWIFCGSLLRHEGVRAYLEDASRKKVAHNLSVDYHATGNAGVGLCGAQDTLNLARWVYPDRANLPKGNYDIDSLARWRVGFGKTEDFNQFLGFYVDEPYQEEVEKKWCTECMDFGCKKKKAPHDVKIPRATVVTRTKKVRHYEHLPDIRPGHPKFERYLKYAAVDAELALILYQMMMIDGQAERWYPYGM